MGPVWAFLGGLLIGQLSVALLVFMAIRYLLFEEVDSKRESSQSASDTDDQQQQQQQQQQAGSEKTARDASSLPPSSGDDALLLAMCNYDERNHPPESADWLNVFVAMIIRRLRADAERHGRLMRMLNTKLNETGVRPGVLDEIKITNLSLGKEFPLFRRARIRPVFGRMPAGVSLHSSAAGDAYSDNRPRISLEIEFELEDEISISMDTRLLVNLPRPVTAALPVSLTLELTRFTGTLIVQFIDPGDADNVRLAISVKPGYELQMGLKSSLGSRTKVQDLPKLASLIIDRITRAFESALVTPNAHVMTMPTAPWRKRPQSPQPSMPQQSPQFQPQQQRQRQQPTGSAQSPSATPMTPNYTRSKVSTDTKDDTPSAFFTPQPTHQSHSQYQHHHHLHHQQQHHLHTPAAARSSPASVRGSGSTPSSSRSPSVVGSTRSSTSTSLPRPAVWGNSPFTAAAAAAAVASTSIAHVPGGFNTETSHSNLRRRYPNGSAVSNTGTSSPRGHFRYPSSSEQDTQIATNDDDTDLASPFNVSDSESID